MTDYYAERRTKAKRKKFDWHDMTPEYESLKMEIMQYKELYHLINNAKMMLQFIYDDIHNKKESLARQVIEQIVQKHLEKITIYFRKLPDVSDFFQDNEQVPWSKDGLINRAFTTQKRTLLRIQAKLMTELEEVKLILENNYINTPLYNPDESSFYQPLSKRSKYKEDTPKKCILTEKCHWDGFCEYIEKMEQGQISQDTSPTQSSNEVTGVVEDTSPTQTLDEVIGADTSMVQLLHTLKMYCI